MDNPETQILDNPETHIQQPNPSAKPETFSWKGLLNPDFAGSPTMQKFSDTKDGFNEAVKAHLSLEKMLGHEKVVIPKSPEDKEAWDRFSKAIGVPEKPDGYKLPDVTPPAAMKGLAFDKKEFQEVVHDLKLSPDQAKKLWDVYTKKSMDGYSKALRDHENHMTEVVNGMRSEWGDAYDSNVELGQMVINKFTDSQEMNDYVTATLAKSPMGIKFLSKIGTQFSENKIGDFANQRFSLTPEQAQAEIDAILRDEKHPYNSDKATPAERDRAINYVNSLYAVTANAKR